MGIASCITPKPADKQPSFSPRPKTTAARSKHRQAEDPRPETFSLSEDGLTIHRTVHTGNGESYTTPFELGKPLQRRNLAWWSLAQLADQMFLRSAEWPPQVGAVGTVRSADLFSGCGAMSLGVWEACRAIGKRMEPVLAVDSNPEALRVFKKNFATSTTIQQDITHLLDSPFGAPPSHAERELAESTGHIDVLLGGAPCQGHSNLNNHTRRSDPKNGLYERMARFAELVHPTHVVIENVPAVLHDRGKVVDRATSELKTLGYNLDHLVIELSSLGVPQRRRRHVLVASLNHEINLAAAVAKYQRSAPTIEWAISDLEENGTSGPFNTASNPTPRNLERIEYLFKHNCYELPDTERPDCHRLYERTYRSVYGRLHWNKPAQTITGGFGCMGQGRFVHPKRKRTLTPHEAARLQFIPDFFTFDEVDSRTAMALLIGNAVPPKLTYVIALELLR